MYWLDVWGFRGVVECGRPMKMDNELITALIERWRPKTQCFHLPVGEVTVALQDVQSLWGLRADGRVFTGRDYPIRYEDWPSKCRDVLGWIPDAETETKQGGLLMTSLIHQATIPLGDGLHEYAYIQRARIHALILLGGLIIPDTTGCKVPFMWLNAYDDPEEVANISWGSDALAFLYHYLCEASVGRHKRDVGGPMFLWTPYADCILPDYCIDSTASFLCDTYLVCWSFVEAHEARRVCRQFNRYQRIPQYCDRMLHNAGHLSKSHRRGRKGTDWAKVHKFFIDEWD
ncbi:serine/threonine-protein phosphatase 7 long form homolog [Salvia splendens]|uniref:serine/threonine-protein phosphatase 7 long form homolog n=1 Tax=Salvia splendens TaxID=180675 RepID=UPI001C2767DB|nr:serine/threonine-protein phosphatase 7 long form homolog [Salvia splendens]